ncbi:MAG: AbrB/MazE/SpoVT family DNA-binding domain-containing protein [Candidatus Woesearchaeota archaeon]|nr:AbrB/MazE/SpoVT family DNA-binding domain-containing protein [Candidatus Woesearchaeota archaeon]
MKRFAFAKNNEKGRITLPKRFREHIKIRDEKKLFLECKNDRIIIHSPPKDTIQKFERSAKVYDVDVSKIKTGNDFYEEVFGEKWDKLQKNRRT